MARIEGREGPSPGPLLVTIAVSSADEARKISHALVEERLAACVQATPVSSTYRWEGSVESADEVLLLAKSREDLLERLIARVEELHSYQCPEVVAARIVVGSSSYLRWLDEALGGPAA